MLSSPSPLTSPLPDHEQDPDTVLRSLRPASAGERFVGRSTVEYRVIYVARPMAGQPNDGVETDLNTAAREGWRLAGSLTNDEGRTTGLILERDTNGGQLLV